MIEDSIDNTEYNNWARVDSFVDQDFNRHLVTISYFEDRVHAFKLPTISNISISRNSASSIIHHSKIRLKAQRLTPLGDKVKSN